MKKISTRAHLNLRFGLYPALYLCLCLGMALFLPMQAHALAPHDPPKAVASAVQGMRFMGAGTLRWLGLRVYDSQLWSSTAPKQFDYSRNEAWLELKYARSLKGKDIAKRSIEEIEGLGQLKEDQRQAWLNALVDIFPDVKEGDTLGAHHQPGVGIQFYRNGQPLAKLNNPELAKAFMGIWLDPKTSQPKMREQMLGLAP